MRPPEQSKSRPQPGSGPARNTIGEAKLSTNDRHVDGSSPIEAVLERLQDVRRSGDGWTAKCPHHHDRNASLSVGTGRDGRVLIFCFAGCPTEDIVRSIGLTIRDLFSDADCGGSATPPRRRRPGKKVPYHVAKALADRPHFPEEWELIKLLARLPQSLAQQDIVRSWDYLIERYDLEFVIVMSNMVREAAA
jgi:hypothetical protein